MTDNDSNTRTLGGSLVHFTTYEVRHPSRSHGVSSGYMLGHPGQPGDCIKACGRCDLGPNASPDTVATA